MLLSFRLQLVDPGGHPTCAVEGWAGLRACDAHVIRKLPLVHSPDLGSQ